MNNPPTRLTNLLSTPFVGFAPWILMSVIEGPHRFEIAAALACALAILLGLLGVAVRMRPKLLDLAGIAFFGVLIVIGAVAAPGTLHWLHRWSGELSNAAIALAALASIVVGQPFTIQYARETTPREHWSSPLFIHINYVLTWMWTGAFALTAAVGYVGDGPLHQPDNMWTNWIIQIGAIILALKFTDWYPDYASAHAEQATGKTASRAAIADLLQPVARFLVPVGILILIVGPWLIGAGLIVVGILITRSPTRRGPSRENPGICYIAPIPGNPAPAANRAND